MSLGGSRIAAFLWVGVDTCLSKGRRVKLPDRAQRDARVSHLSDLEHMILLATSPRRLGRTGHLTPTKSHQRRGFRYFDPARRQILQHAHPVDLSPAHRNHRHRPKTPQPKPWRVTSLSGPTVTSLSGVYICDSHKVYYGIFISIIRSNV